MEERKNEIILFENQGVKLEVNLKDETVWLNRQQMATLFNRDVKTIGKHINNALAEELADIPTVAKFATVQKEGERDVTRDVEYYNLDMIISLGYRIKSVNRKLLTGAGSVSHKQALEKAKSEYRKYQEITLTPVEKAYLESIKEVSKEVKRR